MKDAESLSRVFGALSSETRVMLGVALLQGPKRLNELARLLEADPSNLRKMLVDMERAGLVFREGNVWHASPLLASLLSSIAPPKKRVAPKLSLVLPSLIVFMIAAVQASLQGRPLWLLGGLILALLLALAAYIASKWYYKTIR